MSNGNVTMRDKTLNLQPKKILPRLTKNSFEKTAWQVKNVVCGIDEVGRGCLAGPLVTAAVILPSGKAHRMLRDSKTMTEAERYKAYLWIKKHCFYGIGIASNRVIDRHNIWQATLIAMQRAVTNLMAIAPQTPAAILVDAMPLKMHDSIYRSIPVHHFPKGEQKSSSIAAASILAKVWRDELITRMSYSFPGYALEEHKGYATKKHQTSLNDQHISLIHRITFLKNEAQKKGELDEQQQQRLC